MSNFRVNVYSRMNEFKQNLNQLKYDSWISLFLLLINKVIYAYMRLVETHIQIDLFAKVNKNAITIYI